MPYKIKRHGNYWRDARIVARFRERVRRKNHPLREIIARMCNALIAVTLQPIVLDRNSRDRSHRNYYLSQLCTRLEQPIPTHPAPAPDVYVTEAQAFGRLSEALVNDGHPLAEIGSHLCNAINVLTIEPHLSQDAVDELHLTLQRKLARSHD